MASSEQTTKRHLNKPQPEDFVNVINDICDNMDNLDDAVPDSRKVNGHALNGDVTVSKSDVGLGNVDNVQQAPATRKVNNKPLSSDINLQGTDIQVSSSDSRKVDAAIANCDSETASLKSALDAFSQIFTENTAGTKQYNIIFIKHGVYSFTNNTSGAISNLRLWRKDGTYDTVSASIAANATVQFIVGERYDYLTCYKNTAGSCTISYIGTIESTTKYLGYQLNGSIVQCEGKFPTFSLSSTTITVSFESGTALYAVDVNGVNSTPYGFASDVQYTIPTNNILVWDLESNTISVIGKNSTRNKNYILLLNNRQGNATQGALSHFYNNWLTQNKTILSFEATNIISVSAKNKLINDIEIGQSIITIGDKFVVLKASKNDHSNYGTGYIYDASDYSFLRQFSHNIGHCNSASYCMETDTVLICNSGDSIADDKTLTLVPNAATNLLELNNVLYDNVAVPVDLSGIGYKLVACFGETKEIVYLSCKETSASNSATKFYKLMLGMGSNDFSATGYGTFISGKQANEYNGTAKVLQEFVGSGLNDSSRQGMCFYNGVLYVVIDGGYAGTGVYKMMLSLTDKSAASGRYSLLEKFVWEQYDTNQDWIYSEPQGITPINGINMLLQCNGGTLLIPLTAYQTGTGIVGEQVELPFKCTNTPNVVITPLSSTVDLYISQIANDSFTVDSVSNGNGTFNWLCQI